MSEWMRVSDGRVAVKSSKGLRQGETERRWCRDGRRAAAMASRRQGRFGAGTLATQQAVLCKMPSSGRQKSNGGLRRTPPGAPRFRDLRLRYLRYQSLPWVDPRSFALHRQPPTLLFAFELCCFFFCRRQRSILLCFSSFAADDVLFFLARVVVVLRRGCVGEDGTTVCAQRQMPGMRSSKEAPLVL